MADSAASVPAELARQVAPVVLARERTLPVRPDLESLIGHLQRGRVVEVAGSGATSLALALAAGPSAAGSWTAAVALPGLGVLAAVEAGIDPDRLALVPRPEKAWATVVAGLVDAVDVVLAAVPGDARPVDARRLAARARERGAVLVVVVGAGGGGAWPDRADLRLRAGGGRWEGIDAGHGHLRQRRLEVAVAGRGAAGRLRSGVVVQNGAPSAPFCTTKPGWGVDGSGRP